MALPLHWPKNEQEQTGTVDPDRLPAGWLGLSHPDTWSQQLTRQFASHIWAGQRGTISLAHRFQLRATRDDDDESPDFQTTQHTDSRLKFGPEARLFLRRLMTATENDPHAQAEVRSHLPGQPDKEVALLAFDELAYEELEEMVSESEVMTELLRATQDYELEGPIQVRCYFRSALLSYMC